MQDIRRTYKYRLYRNRRNKHLYQAIDIAGLIWNHSIALQRRYYRLTGKYIALGRLKSHLAKLRMKTRRFAHWKVLGSQAVQAVAERLDLAYQRFFKQQGGRPSFKKVKKYRSFTLKQAGWKLLDANRIQILGKTYKFVKHREIGGTIKTVTLKRDGLNRLWIVFSVVESVSIPKASTGKIGGFDFGLKTFLTDDEGRSTHSRQFFKQALHEIGKANRTLARKQKDSHRRQTAKRQLGKAHVHVAHKRRDHHFKLAHFLCDEYDVLVFETLNLQGMKRLWGRKVSDLGFAQFIEIVQNVAMMRGKTVVFIDPWEPTSQRCSACGHRQKMDLAQRIFACSDCGLQLDRDHNAAINIKRVGASTLGLEAISRSLERNLV